MVNLTSNRLKEIEKGLGTKRIAVIGDLMLDRYFWGTVSRISPEAPVPIVEIGEESVRLGGAANVANNIASLGGIPFIVGVVGKDSGAESIKKIITEKGFSTEGIIVDESRPTTVKTRVIANNQHIVRIDREKNADINSGIQKKLFNILSENIENLDAIILEDYNKGVMNKELIQAIINLAKDKNKIVTVDPKFNNFFEYKNVTVFKPNRRETEEALGCRLNNEQDAERAAREVLKRLDAENVLLTLGENGMLLVEKNGNVSRVETKARHVADVSGAGDTVIAALTIAIAAGATMKEAATIANYAGGVVCGEVGIVPIERELLIKTILQDMNHKN